MKYILVDTSAWVALADKKDKDHTNALRFRDKIVGKYKLLTSDYVLDELYTLLLMNVGFLPTVNYKEKLDTLIAEHVLDVIWIDHDLAKRGWDVFEQYNSDKLWSFTDCTSFVVMKEFGITEVFAFDHHFEQMGIYPSAFTRSRFPGITAAYFAYQKNAAGSRLPNSIASHLSS